MIQKGDEWIDAKGRATQKEYLADTFTKPEKASGKIFTHALNVRKTAIEAKIAMIDLAKEYYEWLCETKPEYKDKKSCVITSFDKSIKIEYTMKPVVRIYVYLATKENPSSGDYKRQELDFGALDINNLLDREKVDSDSAEKLDEYIKKNPVLPKDAIPVSPEVIDQATKNSAEKFVKQVDNAIAGVSLEVNVESKIPADDTQENDNQEEKSFLEKTIEKEVAAEQQGEDAIMSGSPSKDVNDEVGQSPKEEKPYKSLAEQNEESEKRVDQAVKEDREAEEKELAEQSKEPDLIESPEDGQTIEVLFADGPSTKKSIKIAPNSHLDDGNASYPEIGMLVMCEDGETMAKVTSVEKIIRGAHIMRILLTAGSDLTPFVKEGKEVFVYPDPEVNAESAG